MSAVQSPTTPWAPPDRPDRPAAPAPSSAAEPSFSAILGQSAARDGAPRNVGFQQQLVTDGLWRRADPAPQGARLAPERKDQSTRPRTAPSETPTTIQSGETAQVIGSHIDLASLAAAELQRPTPASPAQAEPTPAPQPRGEPHADPRPQTHESASTTQHPASTNREPASPHTSAVNPLHPASAPAAPEPLENAGRPATAPKTATGTTSADPAGAATSAPSGAAAAAIGNCAAPAAIAPDRTSPASPSRADALALLRSLGARSAPQRSAAPSPPATSLFQTEHEDFGALIGRGLAAAMRQRNGVVTIQLRPQTLGDLKVRIGVDGDSVAARFEASTPQARDLLKENLHTLRSALEARGLQVDRLHVDLSAPSGAPDSREQPPHHGAGDRPPTGQDGHHASPDGGAHSGGSGRERFMGPGAAPEAHGGAAFGEPEDAAPRAVPPVLSVRSDAHDHGGVSTILRLDAIA